MVSRTCHLIPFYAKWVATVYVMVAFMGLEVEARDTFAELNRQRSYHTSVTDRTTSDSSVSNSSPPNFTPVPGPRISQKWAVVIGTGAFQYGIPRLTYAAKDATDFSSFINSKWGVPAKNITLLVDGYSTRANVCNAILKELPRKSGAEDDVIIYFSGHGSPPRMGQGKNYWVVHDTQKDALAGTAIDSEWLAAEAKRLLPQRNVYFFVDAVGSDAKKLASLSGGSAAAACRPDQRAWESKRSPNSVFTAALMKMSTSFPPQTNTCEAIAKIVQTEALQDFGVAQNPEFCGAETKRESSDDLKLKQSSTQNLVQSGSQDEKQRESIVQNKAVPNHAKPLAVQRPQTTGKGWALLIGTSSHQDSSLNLRFATKDAMAVRDYLLEIGYDATHIYTVCDEHATTANIEKMFNSLSYIVQPQDCFVFYYSGHLCPGRVCADNQQRLVLYDFDKTAPQKGLTEDKLASLLSKVRTEHSVAVFDSGINEDVIQQRSGKLILSARSSSKGRQGVFESKLYEGGIFTKHLLDALRSEPSAPAKAFDKSKNLTAAETLQTYGETQTPEARGKDSQWIALGRGDSPTAPDSTERKMVVQLPNESVSVSSEKNAIASSSPVNLGTDSGNSSTPQDVTLSPGKNRPVNDKWALIVGISKFARPAYNLRFAAKDALDFYEYLVSECGFAKDHVKVLLNESATRTNIMSAFGSSWLPKVCMPDDMVVVFMSTHGTPSSRDVGKKNYIVAYDTDRDELFGTGVNMTDLCSQIKERVKTDRVLIVMDTCFSGGAGTGAKGSDQSASIDAKAIALGTGRLVLSSSDSEQRSWESKSKQNGIFTYNLLEVLRRNGGNVIESFPRLKHNVEWEAKTTCDADQSPVLAGKWEGEKLILTVPTSEPRTLPPNLIPPPPGNVVESGQ